MTDQITTNTNTDSNIICSVLIPSRKRPERLMKIIQSVFSTCKHQDRVILKEHGHQVEVWDPWVEEYKTIVPCDPNVKFIVFLGSKTRRFLVF